jgi:TonB family protein
MSFIYKYLRYPKEDEKNDVRGKVIISFVIEKDGSMTDFEVVKSLSMTADGEALRVVKMITQKWEPGTQNGQPVRVKFTVPIMFPPLQPW